MKKILKATPQSITHAILADVGMIEPLYVKVDRKFNRQINIDNKGIHLTYSAINMDDLETFLIKIKGNTAKEVISKFIEVCNKKNITFN